MKHKITTYAFEPKIGAAPGTQPHRYISMLAWLYTEQRGMFYKVKRSDRRRTKWYGGERSRADKHVLAYVCRAAREEAKPMNASQAISRFLAKSLWQRRGPQEKLVFLGVVVPALLGFGKGGA